MYFPKYRNFDAGNFSLTLSIDLDSHHKLDSYQYLDWAFGARDKCQNLTKWLIYHWDTMILVHVNFVTSFEPWHGISNTVGMCDQ